MPRDDPAGFGHITLDLFNEGFGGGEGLLLAEPVEQVHPQGLAVEVGGKIEEVGLGPEAVVIKGGVGADADGGGEGLAADGAAHLQVPLQPDFEYAVLVLTGAANVEGEVLAPDTLLYLGTGRQQLKLECSAACRLILIGGEPFDEEILLWWNFVARHPEEMAEATNAWNTHTYFGDVEGSPSPRLIAPDISGLHLRGAGK